MSAMTQRPVKRTSPRPRRVRRGALTLEFAMILPLLGLIFLGTVDFCRAFRDSQILQDCANSAALFASGTAKPASGVDADTMARNIAVSIGATLSAPIQSSDVDIVHTGGAVTVTVNGSFTTIARYPGLSQTIALSRGVTLPQAPTGPGGY